MRQHYKLLVTKRGELIQKCSTHSLRRFLKNLRTINWENDHPVAYLKVSYGKHKDNFGKLTNFDNEGEYRNETDLWQAFNAFIEK